MDGFSDFLKITNIKNPEQAAVSTKVQFSQRTEPIPNDSVEISSKKEKQPAGFAKVAVFLTIAAAALGAGTYGGAKIFDKYFQKLACGLKKSEINEALFNFIKKTDPKGNVFSNKEEIKKINEKLTDENFLILKQLSKMKKNTHFYNGISNNRFTIEEISELLLNTNELNIKYLDRLAKISGKTMFGEAKGLRADEILKIIKEIKPENEKIVQQLIQKAGADDAEPLLNCIKGVTKENADFYSLVLSTRRSGTSTELKFEEISKIAEALETTKNPKCAELFLNAQKKNGTGTYRHDVNDILEYLKVADEEKAGVYKKLYDLKCADGIEDLKPLIKSVNNENIDVLEPLLTKDYQCLDSRYVVFSDWDCIHNILKETNEKNKDVVNRLINICDKSHFYDLNTYNSEKTQDVIAKLVEQFNTTPESLEKAEEILNKGVIDGKQTLGIKQFFEKYRA